MNDPKAISLATKIQAISSEFIKEIENLQDVFISKLESITKEFNLFIKSLGTNDKDKLNQRDIYLSSLKKERDTLKDLYHTLDFELNNKLKKIREKVNRSNDNTFNNLQDKINDLINDNLNEDNSSSKGTNDTSISDSLEFLDFCYYLDFFNNQEDIPEVMKDLKINKIEKNNSENSQFNSSNDINSILNKNPILKCKTHKDRNAVYQCKVHAGENFCEECYGLLGKKSEHGILVKISNLVNRNSSSSQNREKRENFLSWIHCFIKNVVEKCNILLNLNIIPNLDKISDVNYVEFEVQKRFLSEVFAKHYNLNLFSEEDKKPNEQLLIILKEITSANRVILQSAENNVNIFEKIEKHSKFSISIFPHRNLINTDKLTQEIKSISKHYYSEFFKNYNIATNNVFLIVNDYIDDKNHKNIYIIKEKEILDSMTDLYEIHYFKINFLIKDCQINQDKLEPKYDSIYFKREYNSIIKGENYYSPEGYFGIGIKIEKDDNLPFAYLTLSNKYTKKQLGYILYDLIEKKNLNKIVNPKINEEFDKRHWAKVGAGIYLFPNIANADKYSGTFEINGKNYKIVLMVKVLKDKIKEPKHNKYGFWVVEKEYVKICRIIFKENIKF